MLASQKIPTEMYLVSRELCLYLFSFLIFSSKLNCFSLLWWHFSQSESSNAVSSAAAYFSPALILIVQHGFLWQRKITITCSWCTWILLTSHPSYTGEDCAAGTWNQREIRRSISCVRHCQHNSAERPWPSGHLSAFRKLSTTHYL